VDRGTRLKNCYGFAGVARLNNFKAGISIISAESIRNSNSSSTINITGLECAISSSTAAKRATEVLFRLAGGMARVQIDAVGVSGIVKTNRVSSAVDVTSIRPPCACAICEAIWSPSPRP
jgi:hypothetical protein